MVQVRRTGFRPRIHIKKLVLYFVGFVVATWMATYVGPVIVRYTDSAGYLALSNLEVALALVIFAAVVADSTVTYLRLDSIERALTGEPEPRADGGIDLTDDELDPHRDKSGGLEGDSDPSGDKTDWTSLAVGTAGGAVAGGAIGAIFGPAGVAGGAAIGAYLGNEYAERIQEHEQESVPRLHR